MKISLFSVAALSAYMFSAAAHADDYVVTIQDHAFAPHKLLVPAGKRNKITIKNLQPTPVKIKSEDLNYEKAIIAGSSALITIPPLEPDGHVIYIDALHEESVGIITAQ